MFLEPSGFLMLNKQEDLRDNGSGRQLKIIQSHKKMQLTQEQKCASNKIGLQSSTLL